jgi:hypothetical protein
MSILKRSIALILFALGVYRLLRASHPRGAGMRVGGKDLVVWSFLMAGTHGAGLMVLPILLAQPMHGMTHSMPAGMPAFPTSLNLSVIGLAVLIHTASMLVVAGILAVAFFETYEKAGLQLLRHTWLNFDLIWAIALLVAGVAVVFF